MVDLEPLKCSIFRVTWYEISACSLCIKIYFVSWYTRSFLSKQAYRQKLRISQHINQANPKFIQGSTGQHSTNQSNRHFFFAHTNWEIYHQASSLFQWQFIQTLYMKQFYSWNVTYEKSSFISILTPSISQSWREEEGGGGRTRSCWRTNPPSL